VATPPWEKGEEEKLGEGDSGRSPSQNLVAREGKGSLERGKEVLFGHFFGEKDEGL